MKKPRIAPRTGLYIQRCIFSLCGKVSNHPPRMSYMPLPISGRACVGRDNVSIAFHSFRVLQDIPAQPSAYILYCILPLQYPQKLDPLSLTFGGQVIQLRATALCHYVSGIATSAPSTTYAVPLPRDARGRLELWHLSFPRHNGGAVNVIQSHVANARVLGSFSHTTCFPISYPL